MTLKEAKKNIGKEVYLIDEEKVTLIKIIGDTSCMVLSGPEKDKYTYVQIENIKSSNQR